MFSFLLTLVLSGDKSVQELHAYELLICAATSKVIGSVVAYPHEVRKHVLGNGA